jgi:hypothetical protein
MGPSNAAHTRRRSMVDSWRKTTRRLLAGACALAKQDRFQRQFLRPTKCYRDGPRLIGSMTVLGGQLNVREQQIITSGAGSRGSADADVT